MFDTDCFKWTPSDWNMPHHNDFLQLMQIFTFHELRRCSDVSCCMLNRCSSIVYMQYVRITHGSASYFCPGNTVVAPKISEMYQKISCRVLMTAFYAYPCTSCIRSIIRFLQQLKPQFIVWSLALGVHTHNGCAHHPHWKIDHLAKMGLRCLIKFWLQNRKKTVNTKQ